MIPNLKMNLIVVMMNRPHKTMMMIVVTVEVNQTVTSHQKTILMIMSRKHQKILRKILKIILLLRMKEERVGGVNKNKNKKLKIKIKIKSAVKIK